MAEIENVKKFLDFLGKAEGADYNTIVGGKKFEDLSKHPRVVGLVTKEGKSTAAGKYQITATTYDDFAPKVGVTDFSPASQDKIALAIIEKEGALEDVKAGRFDAAIGKLGNRWASLPSSPYSQNKRSPEWAAKELGSPSPSVPLQGTLTNPSGVAPTASPGQPQLLMADLKKAAENDGFVNTVSNIPGAISRGFQNENNAYNWWVEQGAAKADPNFSWTKEKVKEATAGLPEDYRGYILDAVSDDDIARRRARLEQAVQRQQELANMGPGMAFMGAAAGSLLDVDTLLAAIPGVGVASKGSRLANAVKAGLAAGATNAGIEAVFGSNRPTSETSDIYLAGLFGLGLGGAAGAMKKTVPKDIAQGQQDLAKWAQKESGRIQQQEIKDAGLQVTETGKKILDPELRDDPLVDVDTITVRDETTPVFQRTDMARVDETPTIGAAGRQNLRERPAGSAKAALSDIVDNGTPEEKLFAGRLMEQLPDDVSLYTVPKKDLYRGSRPYYDPNAHAVYISRDTNKSVQLHEIAHAVTVHKLDYGLKNLESAHGQLSKQIQDIYKMAKDKADADGFKSYYLKDVYEFTAGLYGGGVKRKDFVDFLSKIKMEDDSLLGKFVDAVRKLLGMDSKETNAFLKSLDLTDKLADTRLNVTLKNRTGAIPAGATYPVGSKSIRLAEDIDSDFLPPKAAPGQPEGFWQGPAYENFFNRPWVPDEVKSFVRSIFGSSTGYKDHSVVAPAAMDQKKALAGQWQNQFAKSVQPAVQEFLTNNQVPFLKRSEALEKWNEDLGDYIRGVPGNYDPTVIKVGDEWRRLSKSVVDHINNPGKFNGDVKKGLTQVEIIDPATGQKTLSDPLDYNENYLPRIPDTYKMSNAIAQFGRDTIETYIGNMFRSANSNISQELAQKLGTWYLRTVEEAKVNRASDLVDNMLRGFDRIGFKDSLIKIGGLNPNDADRVIAAMSKPAKGSDAGALNSSLKRRSVLDETYTEQVILRNGSTETLSYKDLFDTDTVGMINNYFNKQAGAISLANHTGLYNVQSVKKTIAEITNQEFGSEITDEQLTKMRKHLEDIVDLALGRPLEEFSTHNKALQMVADYNVLTKAGLFVLNQITELSQMLGSSMHKSVLRSVPELGNLIRDTKTGKVNNDVIDALENLSAGPGTALLRDNPLTPNRTWVREKGDTAFNRWLDSADNLLKKGTSNLFKFTGMTGVQVMQQRTLAVAMVNHFVDHAVNGKKLGISPERLAWMGLNDADTKAVMQGIKTYHKAGKGRLGEVDFNQWAQNDPKSFSKFVVAYQRESARIIQENDLSSMVPIMGKQIGQTVFQFMGFPLHAWNKSMLFAVNHRDIQTLNTVMYAIAFNTLMYVARTNMQMVGMSAEERKEFADKRLAAGQITLNAVGRIPQLSVLPNIFDTVSPVPLFSGMRTSTDLTDFVSGNPTLSTISGALSMSKKVARNTVSEDYQTTEKDMKKIFQLMPLNNVMGINQILSSVASDYPTSEKVDD